MSFRPRAVALKKKPVAAASAPAPAASTSSASADETNNAQGGPAAPASSAMVPRAIAKRTKVAPAKPSPLSTLAVATVPQEDDGPVASTSKALAAVKLDPKEEQRLELLLSTIESCLCDWGLSCHLESGMLERLRDGKDGCELAARTRLFESCQVFSTDSQGTPDLHRCTLPANPRPPTSPSSHFDASRRAEGTQAATVAHPRGASVTGFSDVSASSAADCSSFSGFRLWFPAKTQDAARF